MPPLDNDALCEIYDCAIGEEIDEDPDTDQTKLLAEHVEAIATVRTVSKNAAAHLHQRLLDATFVKVWRALKYNEKAREETLRSKMLPLAEPGSAHRIRAITALHTLNAHMNQHLRMCQHLEDLYKDMSVDAGVKACKAGVRSLRILRDSGDYGWTLLIRDQLHGFPDTESYAVVQ